MTQKKVDAVVFEERDVNDGNAAPSNINKRRKTYESFQEFSLHDHPPTTYLETMMHLLKGNIGTGVFAMADAMRNSGILLGPVLTVIIGVICVHAQHMLIKSADFLKAKNNLLISPNFAETVKMSFLNSKSEKWKKWGPPMKLICNIFICLTQLGFCSVYLLFVGKNLKDVFEHHGVSMDIHVWVTIGLVPIWLTSLIRTLKIIGKEIDGCFVGSFS